MANGLSGDSISYVTRPGAPVCTRASFVVEDGQPSLKQLTATLHSKISYLTEYTR